MASAFCSALLSFFRELARYIHRFEMHRLTVLFTYIIALAATSPIAWPDDKLEEINALRAKGVSEVSRLSQAFSRSQSCIRWVTLSV